MDRLYQPCAATLLPASPTILMGIVGVLELAVGIAILTTRTRVGALVAAAWLVAVAANLALGGFLDIAVRDIVMAIAAFTLARLTAVRQGVPAHHAVTVGRPLHHEASA